VAWDEALEAVAPLGLQPAPSETAAEFAARSDLVLAADVCDDLAACLEAAVFSAEGVDQQDAEEAYAAVERVTMAVHARTTRQQRLRAVLDPRPVNRRRPRRRAERRRPPKRRDAPPVLVERLPR
jgi:hypothetical protein